MNSNLILSWESRLKSFVYALNEHQGDEAYTRIILNFNAFMKEWQKDPEAMFTRKNIKWFGDEWRALSLENGQPRMLAEFPDWSFIVTQFQLLVLLSEIRTQNP